MKIRIITFHRAKNYGAVLQAYALQETINSMNHNVEIIDYRCENIEKPYEILDLKTPLIKQRAKNIIKYIIYNKKLYKRKKSFNQFLYNYLNLTNSIYNEKDLKKIETDVYITGSDQVWSKKILGKLNNFYCLNLNDNVKKISYAASVGSSKFIETNKEEYKNMLSKIDNISVREKDVQEPLSKILNKKVEVVLDPTLLQKKEKWLELIKNRKNESKKYILVYVVEPDKECIKIANELTNKTGLGIIHFALRNPGYKKVYKSLYGTNPLDFINYIKNAEYIVSTSFHATAFSIIFNKNFFVIPNKDTGKRVTDLLEKLKIQNRDFRTYEEFKKINYNVVTNWNTVNKRLEEEREKSINWLINAIEK